MWTAKKKEILEALKPIIEKAYPLMKQHDIKTITAFYNGNCDDFCGADLDFETNQGSHISEELAATITNEIGEGVIAKFLVDHDPTGFNNLGASGNFILDLTPEALSIQLESDRFIFKGGEVITANTVYVFDVSIPEDKIEDYLNGVDIIPKKKAKKIGVTG